MHSFPLVASKLHRLILVMRRNFLISATIPNNGTRARSMRSFYARVEHKAVVGVDIVNLLVVTSLILVRRYCWMKRPGPTLRVRLRETGSTDVLRTQVASGCQFLQL